MNIRFKFNEPFETFIKGRKLKITFIKESCKFAGIDPVDIKQYKEWHRSRPDQHKQDPLLWLVVWSDCTTFDGIVLHKEYTNYCRNLKSYKS